MSSTIASATGASTIASWSTAGKLPLEKEQLQALKEPFVGLVKFGGSGWRRVKVQPYFARVESLRGR